jgi:hypothetical protein
LIPQSPQNLLKAGFAAPQAGQRRTSAAPHCRQNFLCSGTSAAQFVQCIRTSTDIKTPSQCARSPAIHVIVITTQADTSPGSVAGRSHQSQSCVARGGRSAAFHLAPVWIQPKNPLRVNFILRRYFNVIWVVQPRFEKYSA